MLPRRWKIFRVVCILQVILAGFSAGLHFVYFMQSGSIMQIINVVCFTFITLFASLGMSLVQNNYPDSLLTTSQKRYFNFQYLFNILLISVIFAHIYSNSWVMLLTREDYNLTGFQTFLLFMPFTKNFLIFVLQLLILYGMFRLRRELYANYLKLVDEIANEPVSR